MRRQAGWMVALVLTGILAGCATPLQQCLYEAERSVRDIERELAEREGNLARGYRIERVIQPRLSQDICYGAGGAPFPCARWEQDVEEILHRIDPALERERIALLQRQLDRERPRAEAAARQCRATYPA